MMLDDDAESECKEREISADGPFVHYPTYMGIYTLILSPAILGVPRISVPSILPYYLHPIHLREGVHVCIAIGVLHRNRSA